ncbi:tripartite tricarboxylate transporter TctB [Allostella sp. ATCC 35155]|nr:tripartite tricarboxylate transporter TctB [Stella sp. ATCC 35155]
MKADLPSGMLWLGIGVFVAYEGYDLGLGVPSDPGSGFVLFWAGLLMAGLALVQLAASVRGHGGGPIAAMWPGPLWWKPVAAIVALAIYGTFLLPVGFLISTVVFLLVLMLAVDRNPPAVAVTVALAATIIVYLVFDRWLGVGLPRGIFHI